MSGKEPSLQEIIDWNNNNPFGGASADETIRRSVRYSEADREAWRQKQIEDAVRANMEEVKGKKPRG